MSDQVQNEFETGSSASASEKSGDGIPFGGTISSIFLMAALSIGVYLLYESVTNDFQPIWKAAYWVATIVALIVSLIWTVHLCGRYSLSTGHMFGGVMLSSLSVMCLIFLFWTTPNAQSISGNGEVLVAVLGVIFGIAALGMNVVKTNLVFGIYLTAVQLVFSVILLLLLFLIWSSMARDRR
ncbi:MAG: hypothetical protein LCH86_23190 [Proteobacteria bacterium]|nr:hypothetical protein [Pseudomonadota bacterium]